MIGQTATFIWWVGAVFLLVWGAILAYAYGLYLCLKSIYKFNQNEKAIKRVRAYRKGGR